MCRSPAPTTRQHSGLELAGGVQAVIQLSAVTDVGEEAFRQQVIVRGEEGTLAVELSLLETEVRGGRGPGESRVLPIPDEYWQGVSSGNPFDVLSAQPAGARLLVNAILRGTPAVPSFSDGWKAQEVVNAALLSAQRGAAVPLPRA